MRRSRTTAIVAIAMFGAIALAGCAKDSGETASGDTGGQTGTGCTLAQRPPAAPAASSSASGSGSPTVDASVLRVGLAYDVGGRGDASFNDAAAAGLDKAKSDLGVKDTRETTAASGESEDAKQSRLRQLAQDGYNPIIAVGFAYADSLAAIAPQFPNTKFAIIDGETAAPNATALVFAEEQGSFLAGVAAAYKSRTCHVGFLGGVDTPLIHKFEAGFAQGAKAAAPDIVIERDYITPAGDITGFQDPARGNIKASALFDRGADVLYQAAGASGKGVFEAAKAKGKLAIGVDSDQYNQKTVEATRDVIMTSMLKRVDVTVFDFVRAVAANDLSALPERFDLAADGVGYATSGGKVDDIRDVLDAYRRQIIDGAIVVSDKPSN